MAEAQPTPTLDNAGLAFGLVIAAGASTAIGAACVFEQRVVKMASKPVLAAGLGFSAGVMLYVSFIEIFIKGKDAFESEGYSEQKAYFSATACFFAGMLMLRLISVFVHMIDHSHHAACDADCIDDAREVAANAAPLVVDSDIPPQFLEAGLVPPERREAGAEGGNNPWESETAAQNNSNKNKNAAPATTSATATTTAQQDAAAAAAAAAAQARRDKLDDEAAAKLQQMGLNTALAIGIHNFPEGLATFVGTLADPSVGVTLAIAIGIHNIPEGLCVALPIYYATDSRLKGFFFACISGASEPIGALIGYAVIKATGSDMDQLVYGILFGMVAGMMVMIVILELLPTAYRYDPEDKTVTTSVVIGMVVMAASLCLFMA
mmetsp:Transcript_78052/g.162106  ORF Transcript_78052/g.162106 Transcript_78052/m.162106 type:complete len:378 (-) Transcript_78052:111-1244(-)|eukprot:CAMPEP_0206444870 /NCGR_PEP_ID=MMETSP0324_2-20121206/15160_1 /ASSEMBLY_ACC=CAM_ASM_000836 /TAXON_ID=2866 /ORGANISM="Crypthecodinium cohnii, Strain Seligo" /LENGTH=377 /DNA_ID=CAMNT_0053912957 /DNA_START=308 /DNA_END=1441 /DNA_ORIENTATION=+